MKVSDDKYGSCIASKYYECKILPEMRQQWKLDTGHAIEGIP
jgi:hypothetical protein